MIIDFQLGDGERSFKRARAVLQEKYVYRYYVYKYISIYYTPLFLSLLSMYRRRRGDYVVEKNVDKYR